MKLKVHLKVKIRDCVNEFNCQNLTRLTDFHFIIYETNHVTKGINYEQMVSSRT